MNKLQQLRTHLLETPIGLDESGNPLRIDPANLLTFAEQGAAVVPMGTSSAGFRLQYTAHIVLTDYPGPVDVIAFIVSQWLDQHQPNRKEKAFQFDADIPDTTSVDLELKIDLDEVVKVEKTETGVLLHHCNEPDIGGWELKDWTLYINDEGFASWQE